MRFSTRRDVRDVASRGRGVFARHDGAFGVRAEPRSPRLRIVGERRTEIARLVDALLERDTFDAGDTRACLPKDAAAKARWAQARA